MPERKPDRVSGDLDPSRAMLILTDDAVRQMQQPGEAGYPHEVCGLLVGTVDAGGRRVVQRVYETRNLNTERAHDRYVLDPLQYMEIESAAAADGLEVIGVWHTHPDHPSQPSETDRARAEDVWGDADSWSYVILEIAQGQLASWNSFVLRTRVFEAEDTQITTGSPTTS